MKFWVSSIKTDVRGTSGTILLADWVDLDALVAVQLREIVRVLGPQGAPAEPDIDPVPTFVQGILSDFLCFLWIFHDFFGFLLSSRNFLSSRGSLPKNTCLRAQTDLREPSQRRNIISVRAGHLRIVCGAFRNR